MELFPEVETSKLSISEIKFTVSVKIEPGLPFGLYEELCRATDVARLTADEEFKKAVDEFLEKAEI